MYDSLLDALESGTTVVTANNRLARTLQHAHEQRQIERNLSAWETPPILTWSTWLRALWQEARLRGGKATGLQLIGDSAATLLWRAAVNAHSDATVAEQSGRLAVAARDTWRLLNDWQALAAEEWTRPDLSPDQRAWLRWSGHYRDTCRQRGLVDAERLCALVQADVAAGSFDDHPPVWFSGFDSWVPARRSLVDALAKRGVAVTDTDHAAELPAAQAAQYVSPDPAGELRAAANWARQLLAERPAARVGVVVPDLAARAAEARRIFLDVLAPDWRLRDSTADIALNVSYGEPLAGVAVIAAALNALRIAQAADGRADFNDLSALLRSRWFAGSDAHACQRADLELYLRKRVRIDCSLSEVLSICQPVDPVFAAVISGLLEHSRQRERRSLKAWAGSFTALLETIGWPGTDSLDSRTWQSLQAWHEVLRELAEGGADFGQVTRGEALGVLSQFAQQRLFQPEGRADGVQVMGLLEAAGHRFEHLWVCGMARELWPPSVRPDPFVPLELQRRLGMPDATPADAIARAERQAKRLRHSTGQLVVSMPQLADGESLTACPLFVTAKTVENLSPAPNWNEAMFAGAVSVVLEDDPPPAWQPGRKVPGGVSVLNLQAVSPLNAFIEKRLGAVEIQPPVIGIDPRQRGNLTHKALEALYSAAPGLDRLAAMSANERDALLRDSLRDQLARLPGRNDSFMQALGEAEIELQLQRLRAFIEVDLGRADFKVAECEVSHTVKLGPLLLELKLDRLDSLADGSQLVIDYKTGVVRRQSWNPGKPRDLQLPLYVTGVVPGAGGIAFAQVSSRGVGYDGVGNPETGIPGMRSPGTRNRVEVKFHYPGSNEVIVSWEALREVWATLLTELAEKFAAGDFRFDPLNPDSARGQFAVLSRVFDNGPGLTEAES